MSFTPQNDETNTPQNNETNTPQNNDTNTPTPQNNETNTPQNDETSAPQNDETNTPQNDETSAPQNSDTNESKLKETKDSYTPQQIAGGCLILLSLGGILCFFIYGWFKTPKTIDLTTFLQLVKAEKVVDIEVKDNLVTTTKKDGKKVKTYIESNIGIYQQLKSAGIEVDNSKVSIQIKPSANLQSFIFSAIPWVFIVILVICIYQLANKK
ncbi:MAG: hypothetical protein O4965_07480, partial [Trichodesmium sp. St19_bin1]|nr:hypothetical protein [Trichodesmium sp. St19_bin1]